MRAIAPVAAVLACLFALAATAGAATLPPEGVFENCSLDTQMATCVQRLTVMHQGGMRVVVIPAWSGSPASVAAYAAAAQARGMKVLWELSNQSWWEDPLSATSLDGAFSAVAGLCGCVKDGAILSALIRLLSALPGTYGYYAVDDSMIGAGDRAGIAAYVAQIKRADPKHAVLIGASYPVQAARYRRIADEIATEVYPVTTGSLMPASRHRPAWSAVAQTAASAQRAASTAGRRSAFILQAFTWGDNLDDGQAVGVCSSGDSRDACYARLVYPSAADQLHLRDAVLTHARPQLILWWSFGGTYGQAGDDNYSIYPTGSVAAARWSGLSAAVKAPYPASLAGGRQTRTHRNGVQRLARRHRRVPALG